MTTTAGKLLLLLNQAITYLLRDLFSFDQSAPLTSPRTATPGPGTLTIKDTGNALTISGGEVVPIKATASLGDPGLRDAGGYARVAGRAFIHRTLSNSSFGSGGSKTVSPVSGWATVTNPTLFTQLYFILFNCSSYVFDAGDLVLTLPFCNGSTAAHSDTYYQIAHVMLSTGMLHFIDQVLVWVSRTGTEATLYPIVGGAGATRQPPGMDYFDVRDLGNIFAPTLNVASPAAATSYAGDNEAIIDVTFTYPNSPTSTLQLNYRYQDVNNRWYVEAMATGAIQLVSVIGGTPTQRLTVTGVFTGGATYTMRVIANSARHAVYVDDGNGFAKKQGDLVLVAPMDLSSTVRIEISGQAWSQTNLICWPDRSAVYSNLRADGVTQTRYAFMPYGDSKTADVNWTNLLYGAISSKTIGVDERPSYSSVSGATVASRKATIDADLAATIGTPDYILSNLGVNDTASMPLEADFETNYGYIFDAMHAKWPNARIYVMYPGLSGQDVNCATLHTWIDVVRSTRSWLFAGPDEAVWLKGSDNYVTNTSDGKHYSAAGDTAAVVAWRAVLGL